MNLISDCTSSECAAGATLEEPRDVPPSFDFGEFRNFLSTRNTDSATGLVRDSATGLVTVRGFIPDIWTEVRIVPVPKRGKDPTKIENYRPNSLLCVPLRVFLRDLPRN